MTSNYRKMTIAQTIQAIKAIDPILTARYISETREYRVSIRGVSQQANENIAYYTEDSDDAIATAKAMLSEPTRTSDE
jgi:hypothetical protein